MGRGEGGERGQNNIAATYDFLFAMRLRGAGRGRESRVAFNVNGVSENYTDGPAETVPLILRNHVSEDNYHPLRFRTDTFLSVSKYLHFFLNVTIDERCTFENVKINFSPEICFPQYLFSRKLSS